MPKLVLTLCATALMFLGCGTSEPPATEAEPAAKVAPVEPDARIAPLVTAYDSLRDALAEDAAQGYSAAFDSVASAAESIGDGLPEAAQAHLADLAEAANVEPADLEAARTAFAAVSEHFVRMVAAAPELAEGLYVIECPMAKDYQKWVQTAEAVENPYMGSKMLDCGMASTWEDKVETAAP